VPKLKRISNHLEEGMKTLLFFFGSYKLTHLKRAQCAPGDMALWNKPCLGPLGPQKGFGFKPHWCAGESLACPLLSELGLGAYHLSSWVGLL
jgi:hypothetical protein